MRREGAVISFSKRGMHGSDYEVGGGGCILYLLAGPAKGRDGQDVMRQKKKLGKKTGKAYTTAIVFHPGGVFPCVCC